MNYEIKDSGKRQKFPTGSVRDTSEGKGRFDLLSPIALDRLAQHTEKGIQKYGERNWELGQPVARFLDSAVRHIYDYIEGKRDEDHLAAAMWNMQGAIHTEEMVRRGKLSADLLKGLPNYLHEQASAAYSSPPTKPNSAVLLPSSLVP